MNRNNNVSIFDIHSHIEIRSLFTFEYGLSDLDVKKVCLRSYFFHNTSTISLVPDDFSLINFQKRKKKLRFFFRNTSQHSTIGTREASRGISHKKKNYSSITHEREKKKKEIIHAPFCIMIIKLKQKEIKALYDFQYVGLNSKTFRKTAILSCNDVHHFALVS